MPRLLLILLSGLAMSCASPPSGEVDLSEESAADPSDSPSERATRYGNVTLVPGMDWEEAQAMLLAEGAVSLPLQVMGGVHYFHLPSGEDLSIRTERASAEATAKILSLAVSRYHPSSWESKMDPERMKWFQSFEPVDRYRVDATTENG